MILNFEAELDGEDYCIQCDVSGEYRVIDTVWGVTGDFSIKEIKWKGIDIKDKVMTDHNIDKIMDEADRAYSSYWEEYEE